MNTVCEKCPEGHYSGSSSVLEMCIKQQKCTSEQAVLLPGSVYHDTVCGSCEDLANGGVYSIIMCLHLKHVYHSICTSAFW